MSALDPSYLSRAAPPGSMRYFALLYAPPEQREMLTALFVIDAEIRATVNVAHDVAHTRLQWWRMEVDRLINRNAQHPATKILQEALPACDFSILHESLAAADMDLARMTYHSADELNAYLERSGGTLPQLLTADPSIRILGAAIRRVETLRDLAIDARAGRIYWPLDELDAVNVPVAALRGGDVNPTLRHLIAAECARLQAQFDAVTSLSRPLRILTRLHARLLDRIRRANYDVFTQRFELGPFEKVWAAWRAARHG